MQASYYGDSEDERTLSLEAREDHMGSASTIIAKHMKEFSRDDVIFFVGDFNVDSFRGSKEEVITVFKSRVIKRIKVKLKRKKSINN